MKNKTDYKLELESLSKSNRPQRNFVSSLCLLMGLLACVGGGVGTAFYVIQGNIAGVLYVITFAIFLVLYYLYLFFLSLGHKFFGD